MQKKTYNTKCRKTLSRMCTVPQIYKQAEYRRVYTYWWGNAEKMRSTFFVQVAGQHVSCVWSQIFLGIWRIFSIKPSGWISHMQSCLTYVDLCYVLTYFSLNLEKQYGWIYTCTLTYYQKWAIHVHAPQTHIHRQTYKMFITSMQYRGCCLAGPETLKSPCVLLLLEADVLQCTVVEKALSASLFRVVCLLYHCMVYDFLSKLIKRQNDVTHKAIQITLWLISI